MSNIISASVLNSIEYCFVDKKEMDYVSKCQKNWKKLDLTYAKKLNKPYSNEDVFFKISVHNLDNPFIYVDALSPGYLSLYTIENNVLTLIKTYGLSEEPKLPIFHINKTGEYLLKRRGDLRFDGTIKFINYSDKEKIYFINSIMTYVFLGCLLYLFFYHFGYFLLTKNKSFLYYILFNIAYSFIILTFSGFFHSVFGNIIIEENLMSYPCFSIFCLFLFANHFLALKKLISNKQYNILLIINYTLLFCGILNLFYKGDLKWILATSIDIMSIPSIIFLYYLIIKNRKRQVLSYFFLMAWFLSYSGVVVLYLYEYLNLFKEYSLLIKYSVMIGCFFEMIINSFGLAYQHKQLSIEKTKAISEARDKKRYQNAVRILVHDLANPLSTASMATHMYKLYKEDGVSDDKKYQNLIEKIDNSLNKLKTIIEDSKNIEKQYNIDEDCNVANVEKELQEMFEHKLKEKNLELVVKGNRKMLIPIKKSILINNILGNFLTNSIKFSENNKIYIIFHECDESYNIKIIDLGLGMSKEQINNISKNIIQTSLGTKNEKGTGFGTQIAISLIKELNGKIDIISPPEKANRGTEITLSFSKHIEASI